MNTRVSSKGQIVLPAELREQDAIVSGQRFLVERLEPGKYLLTREPNGTNAGLVDWLLACPDKDWFKPIPSETTDCRIGRRHGLDLGRVAVAAKS